MSVLLEGSLGLGTSRKDLTHRKCQPGATAEGAEPGATWRRSAPSPMAEENHSWGHCSQPSEVPELSPMVSPPPQGDEVCADHLFGRDNGEGQVNHDSQVSHKEAAKEEKLTLNSQSYRVLHMSKSFMDTWPQGSYLVNGAMDRSCRSLST